MPIDFDFHIVSMDGSMLETGGLKANDQIVGEGQEGARIIAVTNLLSRATTSRV
jgi:hypothetical protein